MTTSPLPFLPAHRGTRRTALPRRGGLGSVALALALLLVACQSNGRRAPWTDMYSLEVRSGASIVATWTVFGGWDVAALPTVSPGLPGTSVTFMVAAYDINGEAIPIGAGDAHGIGYRLLEGAPEGVIEFTVPEPQLYRAGEIHFFRGAPGTTRIELTLIQGGRVRQWTTPIDLTIQG